MECICSLAYQNMHRPCRNCLATEVDKLNARIEDIGTDKDPLWVEANRLKAENETLNTKVAMEQRTVSRFERRTAERWDENDKLRKALEKAREDLIMACVKIDEALEGDPQ